MCLLSQQRKRAKGQTGWVNYFLEVPLNISALFLKQQNPKHIVPSVLFTMHALQKAFEGVTLTYYR